MNTPPAVEPAVRVEGLVNRFGRQVVHDGLDLEITAGEIFGIVGGSGSGKSVLLHSIIGLHRPQAGRVRVFGQDMQHMSPAQRLAMVHRIGVTFQSGALISSLTVAQNLELPLREYHALSAQDLQALVALNLRLVGLPTDTGAKWPSQLSGGMVKRAAMARALCLEPRLLFLDEPTSGLDPISAAGFDELVLSLHAQLGLTVVMITHDLDSLFRTCHRVGVLVHGRIITDTLAGIMDNPDPWIRAYFHGPRARAAASASAVEAHAHG